MEEHNKKVSLSDAIMRDKAKFLEANLKEPNNEHSGGGFQVSLGWLNYFKLRQ